MFLAASEIRKRLGTDIIIEPYNENQLNPNSYNLRLHEELMVYDMPHKTIEAGGISISTEDIMPIDPRKNNPTKRLIIPEHGLVLQPNKLYLGRTVEYTETHNLVPCLNGRSSIGRLGISIHVTAGQGDIGFNGTWTLEIFVVEPVIVYPNMELCQIVYSPVLGEIDKEYEGRYQGQVDATSSRFYREYEK